MKYLLSLNLAVFIILFMFSGLLSHPVTVDGDDNDWTGINPQIDSFLISNGEGVWLDAIGDDLGDGGDAPLADDNPEAYSYPSNDQFKGTEADILEWRVTIDPAVKKIYFLVKIDYDLTWMPFIGILMDMDHISGSGQTDAGGFSSLNVHPDNAWEIAVYLKNMNIVVQDKNWVDIAGFHENYFSPENNLIEAAVDYNNFAISPEGKVIYFTVFSGLQDFDHFRTVNSNQTEWNGGGGLDTEFDPDVYDLCFVDSGSQAENLNNYTNSTNSQLKATTVQAVDFNLLSASSNTWGSIKQQYK